MRIFASIVATFLLLTACASKPSSEQMANAYYGPSPSNYEETIKRYMEGVLKDPHSAQYRFTGGPSMGWQSYFGQTEFGWRVCALINAKNSFGGYVGFQPGLFVIRDERIVMAITAKGSGQYDLGRSIAEQSCAAL